MTETESIFIKILIIFGIILASCMFIYSVYFFSYLCLKKNRIHVINNTNILPNIDNRNI